MSKIEITIDNERVEFVRGVDAGYRRKNAILADMPNGDVIAIYRIGRKWIEAHIRNGIAYTIYYHNTRREAMISAATSIAARRIGLASAYCD